MLRHMPTNPSHSERHVKLFKNSSNQAVRIPRGLELPGDEAVMWKEGHRLVIEPVVAHSLRTVLASLEPLDEEFPKISDPPPDPIDL